MEDRLYWLGWQLLLPGAGKKVLDLVGFFGSPKRAWEASEKEIQLVPGAAGKDWEDLLKRRLQIDLPKEAARLKDMGINFITRDEPHYPENLRKIFDPPPAIFLRGNLLPGDSLAVSVVGSRKPSPYGLAVAEKISKDIAVVGVTVVSGMARGIDSSAHRGAISAGGRTIAVLGCGPDVIYPRENYKLMEKIIEQGAVISEFPPGTPPEPWHFPCRNRIISGLSLGTVVVEAAEKSGALITSDFALEQGRDVMAVPGNVTSILSRGSHRLIKQGARLVEGAGDILDEIGMDRIFPARGTANEGQVKMSKEEEQVYKLLSLEPVSLDQLISGSGLLPQKAMAALMYLEIKGLAKQLPGKFYTGAGPGMF